MKERQKVKIIITDYRKKELKKFIGKVGYIVYVITGYQDQPMYVVVFSLKPLLYNSFFERELEILE